MQQVLNNKNTGSKSDSGLLDVLYVLIIRCLQHIFLGTPFYTPAKIRKTTGS